jgi:hypothetical protein
MEVPAVVNTADCNFGAGASDVVPMTLNAVDVLLSYSRAAGPLTASITVYVPPSISVEAVTRNSTSLTAPADSAETFIAEGVTLNEETSIPAEVEVIVGRMTKYFPVDGSSGTENENTLEARSNSLSLSLLLLLLEE